MGTFDPALTGGQKNFTLKEYEVYKVTVSLKDLFILYRKKQNETQL
jgi:hypothetical protein